jgi:hypothetical protein
MDPLKSGVVAEDIIFWIRSLDTVSRHNTRPTEEQTAAAISYTQSYAVNAEMLKKFAGFNTIY